MHFFHLWCWHCQGCGYPMIRLYYLFLNIECDFNLVSYQTMLVITFHVGFSAVLHWSLNHIISLVTTFYVGFSAVS